MSPLGLWGIRGTREVRSELRVYPNLLGERRRLAAIFLNRGAFGIHAQRQVGHTVRRGIAGARQRGAEALAVGAGRGPQQRLRQA